LIESPPFFTGGILIRFASGRSIAGLLVSVLFLAPGAAAAQIFVSKGSTWFYLDDGSDQGTGWTAPAFDDSGWAAGPAKLGYGDGDEATVVNYGPDPDNKYITTYLRRHFTVADPAVVGSLTLSLLRDDGVVVYINGTEVHRGNMPAGTIGHTTVAASTVADADETTYFPVGLSSGMLVPGDNVIAAEIHQSWATSSDIGFDLELSGVSASVTRGPYLQMGSDSAMTVRWRTDAATDSRVRLGTDAANLNLVFDETQLTTEHVVRVTGLTAATRYYYSVGRTTEALSGGDSTTYFETAPATGSQQPIRIWAIGDSGTANANATAVYDAYLNHTGSTYTDLWLMLGDNAYADGTDAQYQTAVFNMYPQMLKQTVLWPTLGNHDGFSADSASQSGPYYDIFTLPTQAEAGGIASGTEAYYSFDYGNIHFIVLDSYETSRAAGGPMLTWLESDLQTATGDWIVAYWHHPPYSKGSHDSDSETELVEMRENVLPILENYGVDLVLSGHSHSYERSRFIDGHYGLSSTFSHATHVIIPGSGRSDGTGAYAKPPAGAAHQGAVYAVAGNSGQITGGTFDHPAMFFSLSELGSMVVDVNGLTLDAKFLDHNGSMRDYFTVTKGVASDTAPDSFAFTDASDVGQNSVQTSNTIAVTGVNAAATIGVAGGEYSIGCAGTFTSTSGTVINGQTVCVRHTAANTSNASVNTTLTIGGVSDTFTSTTSPDTTPLAFSFTDQGGVEPLAEVISDSITVTGIDQAAVSVTGGQYSINGGGFTVSAGTVSDGDTVQVKHTASMGYEIATHTTLTIGGISDTFTSTTRAADTTPDAFNFTDQTGLEPSATVTSDAVSINGIEAPAAISVSGGSYSIGCTGLFTTTAGTIGNGQAVCVRHTASADFSAATDTTLTVNGVADTFSSTTLAQDTTPDQFTFTDAGNVAPNSLQTSNIVTIGGINDAAPISVSGGEYSIGCAGTFMSTPGTVSNGQTLCVRHTSSNASNSSTDTTLAVGGVADTFSSITTTRLAERAGSMGLLDLLAGLLAVLRFGCRWRTLLACCALLAVSPVAHSHGDVHERIEGLTRQLAGQPNDELLVRRARLYLEQGHAEDARQDLRRALEIAPDRHESFYYLAQAERALGKHLDALRSADRFLAAVGNNAARVRGWVLKGDILVGQGRFRDGAGCFLKATELSNDPNPEHFLKAADAFHAAGSGRSIQILDLGITRLGPLVTLQERALAIELETRQYEGALRRIEQMLVTEPRAPYFLYREGLILKALQRPERSQQALRAALAEIDALPAQRRQTRAAQGLRESVLKALNS